MNKPLHINYFDIGLWSFPHEIEVMINEVFPNIDGVTYSVYGIEANLVFSEKIKCGYKNNQNVKIFNIAISNKKGHENLYINEALHLPIYAGLGNSIFKTKNNVNPNKFYTVESNTFSGFIQDNNIHLDNSINIIKVNIEGAELYLWEDLKHSGLREKFHIFCGAGHDIEKVSELLPMKEYYYTLLKELNITFLRFCHNYPQPSNVNMVLEIKKYIPLIKSI